jgi:hypothetical protein
MTKLKFIGNLIFVAAVSAMVLMDIPAAYPAETSTDEEQCLAGFKGWQIGRYHFAYNGYRDARRRAAGEVTRHCEAADKSSPGKPSVSSQLCLGYFLLSENYRAMPHCLAGLKANRALSATVLGAIYLTADDKLPPEYRDRAVYWLGQVIEGGAAWTMRLMGQALEQDDPAEAMKWFELASKQGDPAAMLGLARLAPGSMRPALEDALAAAEGLKLIDPGYVKSFVEEICRLALSASPEFAADFYDHNKEALSHFEIEGANYADVLGWLVAVSMGDGGLHDLAIDRMRELIDESADLPAIVLTRLHSNCRGHFLEDQEIDADTALRYGELYLYALEKFSPNNAQPKKEACALIMSRYASVTDAIKSKCAGE